MRKNNVVVETRHGNKFAIRFEMQGIYEFAYAKGVNLPIDQGTELYLGPKLHRWSRNKRILKKAIRIAIEA